MLLLPSSVASTRSSWVAENSQPVTRDISGSWGEDLRRPSVTIDLRHSSLFAATNGRLHFFERREIFLEPVDMLLHLDDG